MVVAEDFVDNSILQADFQIFPVFADILPDHPHVCEAWIVTGSKYDVYGGMPWIAKLETFIQKVCSSNIPIAGICFGHQIIARAMGGIVKKSPNGWGLGVDTYYLRQQPCWLDSAVESLNFYIMHQDQIVTKPENAHIIASSNLCEYAILAYGDIANPFALTTQAHPELTYSGAKACISYRSQMEEFPKEVTTRALKSLDTPVDSKKFIRTISRFLLERIEVNRKKIPAYEK
jgi:GMP synthase-like glutamine amidotransferase